MIKTEQVVVNEFTGVRTGKASAALVENIIVEVYDSQMRIRELAGITTPEPRQLVIQPWDANSTHPIEKAIQKANLGLNPAVQGKIIRIFVSRVSTERRQEFVKITKKMAEDGRVAVRHVRRESDGAVEEARARQRHHRGPGKNRPKKICRSSPTNTSPRLTSTFAHKEKEIMTV